MAQDQIADLVAPDRQAMGIGKLGNADLVFKKKFRWMFSVDLNCSSNQQTVPESFVKVAARPKLTTEEVEINFLNGVNWIPGKSKWETITVTYIDVANTTDNQPLWDWLASVYDFTDDIQLNQGSARSDYTGTGTLNLFDGCGNPLEGWVMHNMWPTSMDFGDLDFSSSDNCEISLTLRYSSVVYKSFCPDYTPQSCCTGCFES